MKKKELIIHCSDLGTSDHTIMCDDVCESEYHIIITSTYVGKSCITLWISHATKKVTVNLIAHVSHANVAIQIGIKTAQNNKHSLQVIQHHTAAHTTSTCTIKGIAYDSAIIDYEGSVVLEPGSIQADAQQRSNFLIMSENATVKSMPSLQAHHNELQCGHATTISYLDPVMLWYAHQRGISISVLEDMIEDLFLAFASDEQ